MESIIQQWGHLAVFIGTAIEGEVVYMTGIVASQIGHLSLSYVVLLSFLGALTRDGLLFVGTRRGGRMVSLNRGEWADKLTRASAWVESRPYWMLIFYRFFYGVSSVLVMAMSLSKMSFRRYIWVLVVASSLWAFVYGSLGYLIAPVILNILDWLGTYVWMTLLCLVAGFVLYIYLRPSRVAENP